MCIRARPCLRRVELRHDVARAAAAALSAARGLVPRTTVPERRSLRWLQPAQAGLGDAGRATWLGRSSPLYLIALSVQRSRGPAWVATAAHVRASCGTRTTTGNTLTALPLFHRPAARVDRDNVDVARAACVGARRAARCPESFQVVDRRVGLEQRRRDPGSTGAQLGELCRPPGGDG